MNLLTALFQEPASFFVIIAALLIILSVHEASHALMGYWLGDLTAKREHRLTLNPLRHLDLLGFLALITVGFGWGKPVPFNPYNLRHRRFGPALVAAAGPFSNLLLGCIFAILFRLFAPALGEQNLLILLFFFGGYFSFVLMLFNLIPVPPLDGSHILFAFLSHPRYERARAFLQTQGPFLLIVLILLDRFGNFHLLSWLSLASYRLFGLVAG